MICSPAAPSRSSKINRFLLASLVCATGLANAQFVAYNDHRPSGTTSANATGYDMIFNAAEMPLKDFASGTFLPVGLIVTQTGTPDDFGGNNYPNAGTPVYNLFNGIVDVGNAGIPGIRDSSGTSVTLTFTNLNPANFYKFRGGVVRGNNYADRWSVFSIQSVDGFTDAHVDTSANNNLITISEFPTASLTAGQVAINSGENREGSLIGWDDIAPGADGTFSIRAAQYMGPTPFGNTANASTVYGYGFTAIYLEEVVGSLTAITITNQPQSITVGERNPAVITVGASGSPIRYYWYRNGVLVSGNNLPTFTIPSAVYPSDNGAQFYVVASNSLGAVTSSTATLTVLPDTNAPTVVSAVGELDPTIVTVTFSEAVDLNTVSEATATVFITGTDPDNGLLTQGLYLTNNNTTIVFTTEPRQAGSNYSIKVTGLLDASSQQNPLAPDPTVLPLRQSILLIGFDENNIWKWTAQTNLFGTGWETVGYDDSDPVLWPEGPAGLGNDSDNAVPLRTTTAYAIDSAPQFFRRHFFLPTGTNGLELRMRHVFEDGAVVFINGQEAGRFNVNPGPLSVTTRTPASAAAAAPIAGPVLLPLTNVFAGDNVIAVVVIQTGATSSDIFMAIELSTSVTNFPSGPPTITTQPQSQTVNEGQNVTFTVGADGAQPITYQWRRNGVDISGATASSYTIISATTANNGTYSVFLSNSAGTATSANATLVVNPDLTGPTFISAVANTNLTEILLTFSEPLDSANAQNIAHYAVALTAGGGALTVGSAALVNGTNVLLTTTPRTQSQNYTITINNITDTAAAQNLATPASRPVIGSIIILAPDATTLWRYNSASNNLDGTGWQLPGFNDSAWPTALAGFTTSNNLEITTNGFELRSTNMLAPSSGGPVTAYYRVPFNFPGSTAGATLHLVGVVDDGLVAYVNGVEAGRLRMTNASPVSFTNLATGAGPETTDVHLPLETIVLTNLSGLVSGANLLAIELHQNSATSSDSVLSVQLVAGLQSFADLGPRLHIVLNPNGTVTVSWSGPGTLQQTSALQPSGTVWTDVPGNPNPYTFTPATGQARFFSLRQ